MARINVYATDELYGERTMVGWFDPEASEVWREPKEWNGQNRVGVISGGQVGYQELYRTKGGRWVLRADFRNEFNGGDIYEFVTDDFAKAWLTRCGEFDDTVAQYFGEVEDERGPGRPEVGPAVTLRFPAELIDQVDAAAKEEKMSRAALIRHFVETGLRG